jgi:hypothetical protein
MKSIVIGVLVFCAANLSAQVGIGTSVPDNSAMLDVTASDKGVLFPRLSSTQRAAIVAPATGLHVFDTNSNSLWYFNGSVWINTAAEATLGDVKSGFQANDHSGWLKLDGRSVNTLNTNQQAAAIALGFTTNLPDASSAYLAQKTGTLGAVTGANTTTLTQANLPNVSFTGTAADAGSHNHTGTTDVNGLHTHAVNDPGHSHSQTTVNDDFNNSGGNPPGFTGDSAGSKTWTNINNSTTGISLFNNGNHAHGFTTSTSSNHSHNVSVSSGGSATPINIAPKSLNVNMFIYLGL